MATKMRAISLAGKYNWQLYALLALPILFFFIFSYLPMIGIVMAFQDYNLFKGIFGSKWAGLDVFREVFRMRDFWKTLRNTFMLNGLGLILGFPIPIILAILLNEVQHSGLKRVFQSTFYLPHFLSWVIIGSLAAQMFSDRQGLINVILQNAGWNSIPFLSNKWYWLFTYTGIGIWHNAGWGTIIYLAALTAVNPELFEAVEVDGGGRFTKIWHVMLPGIRSTMVVLLVLRIGKMISIGFEQPYILGNFLVRDFSDVISTFVYRVGIQTGRFAVGTAVGLFQSVVGLILLFTANKAASHFGQSNLW